MNENELREAMRVTMTATRTPPPMDSASAVAAGRRAVHRRRAWAGAAGTATLVVAALAAGPLIIGGGAPDAPGPAQAGGPPAPASATSAPPPTPDPKPTWPLDGDGQPQQDATASSGDRYEQGRKLLAELLEVVPGGWSKPTGETPDGLPLRSHQAAVEQNNSWGYLASAAVSEGEGTGALFAEVHTTGNGLPTDPCDLAAAFWSLGGACEVLTVGTARVGVATPTGQDQRIDQWAAYRHPDGIVVFVAQARAVTDDPGLPALKRLPLDGRKLATLATDRRFHLE